MSQVFEARDESRTVTVDCSTHSVSISMKGDPLLWPSSMELVGTIDEAFRALFNQSLEDYFNDQGE